MQSIDKEYVNIPNIYFTMKINKSSTWQNKNVVKCQEYSPQIYEISYSFLINVTERAERFDQFDPAGELALLKTTKIEYPNLLT